MSMSGVDNGGTPGAANQEEEKKPMDQGGAHINLKVKGQESTCTKWTSDLEMPVQGGSSAPVFWYMCLDVSQSVQTCYMHAAQLLELCQGFGGPDEWVAGRGYGPMLDAYVKLLSA